MAEIDRTRLAGRTQADYDGFAYTALFVPDLNAVAAVGNDVAVASLLAQNAADNAASNVLVATSTNATEAQAGATTSAANLAAAQAIIGALLGVGASPLMVPRNAEIEPKQGPELFPLLRGATYQITPHDRMNRVLIATNATANWTLPLLSELDPGWRLKVWNRSGANLTILRQGSVDVIGVSATSLVIADNTGAELVYGVGGTRFERVG